MFPFTDSKRILGLTVLILAVTAACAQTAQAASRTVCGDGSGSWGFTADTETAAAAAAVLAPVTVDQSAGPGAQTVYEFDGKRYVVESDWGTHYLTGYSPNADGSRRTRSGVDATAGHTVSSTLANLGKVVLISAESGPASGGDIHRYDGVYRCEDTGGAAVENGIATTGGVPVVDIFFNTAEEANAVTGNGWITARIYILREVK